MNEYSRIRVVRFLMEKILNPKNNERGDLDIRDSNKCLTMYHTEDFIYAESLCLGIKYYLQYIYSSFISV